MLAGSSINTLCELLVAGASSTPDRILYRFLPDDDGPVREVTWRQLHEQASAVALSLREHARPGERALVLCPPGIDYIAGLWGALLAGMVAVPALPPRRSSPRFEALLRSSGARVAMVTHAQQQAMRLAQAQDAHPLRFVCVDALPAGELVTRAGTPTELAVLQYTSGSTSTPRGVMLTHAHLLANCRHGARAASLDAEAELVSWLPPYHDMGLIGSILTTAVAGARATMLSPFSFVTHPVRWLAAITRYGGTHAGAPNFGYALCARRVTEAQKETLDLRTWRVAWNGAERVRADTLEAFARAFAPVGFARSAMRPCYGLAEATLMVSFTGEGGPRVLHVASDALTRHEVRLAQDEASARALVSSGRVVDDHEVRVVDPHTLEPTPPGRVGELWVRGPSVAAGYFEQPELSERTFAAAPVPDDGTRWLRTGDLGFVHEGEVFVTGRLKDLLIVRGRNYYPEDIEATVQAAVPGTRTGCGAAFSIELAGEEQVCLVQEVEGGDLDWEGMAAQARAHVFTEHELVLHDVCWVAAGQVPKTSSGKVQRSLVKQRYVEGALKARYRLGAPTQAALPPSPLEATVSEACRALLGISALDREANLFSLGASSVLAMQLCARLELALGRKVPLRLLFEAPTVAQLSRALERAEPLEQLPPLELKGALRAPLSLAQERMWFEHALDPDASAYNVSGALRIDGPLDVPALTRALNRVVARHPILRARYETVGSEVVQCVTSTDLPSLGLDHADSLEQAELFAQTLARTPFDLTRDPVLRLRLVRVHDEQHLLVLVVHHIAADGLSIDVLLDEGFRLYAEERAGTQAQLPEAPSYLDYARFQRDTLHLYPVEQAVAYFRERLAGAPTLLALPTDKPRPPKRSFRGALIKRELPSALLSSLDALAQQHGTTRYMTLLAAFYVLLARSAGTRDLCVGTPVAGRQHAHTEGMVGTFVNMLPMRCTLEPDESFAALLARVRALVLESLEHQLAPFERVVEAVAPARSQAHAPIFQVMFDYQVMRKLRAEAAGLRLTPLLVDRGASQYDLSCSVIDAGDKTYLHLEYRSDLFEHASAERIADRYLRLLESALLEPTLAVSKLPWLSPAERSEILARGRGPQSSAHPGIFLDVFEAWARRCPDATAVTDAFGTLSYAALDARANQLAHYLRAQGVGPDVAVGVCLERSLELLVALLSVLKAGGCYIPLDPVYPRARLADICENAAPRVIITSELLRDLWSDGPATLLVLERERTVIDVLPRFAPDRSTLTPHHLAYIIYTSGSTGRPKGVEIPHAALANFLHAMAREPGLGQGELLLAVTTVSFDIAALELFLPLTVGGCVEIASHALATDGPQLAARLSAGDVRCFQATPATYRMLLEAGFRGAPSLKLLCGGEALPRELADALLPCAEALFNMYGPTETTVWSACTQVQKGAAISLGHPIDNTQLYVLDEHLEPVPDGVVGELYIGGAGVARGYHRQPALSAQRFVLDRFAGPPARMYRTGDAVRFREGGLEFMGRIDQQIKLRGFRIELGEIEAQLGQVEGVDGCAVKLWRPPGGEARLVAYVVGKADHTLDAGTLRAALRKHLPDYMVPSDFIALAALPRTPNGKLDRNALPEPELGERIAPPHAPPRDALEETLCALFERVLARPQVGIHESFFDLGGHSILAVRLFEQLYAHTGLRLPLATLFEASTVADLAALLRERMRQAEDPFAARLLPWSDPKAGPLEVVFVHPQGTGSDDALAWYRPLAERFAGVSAALACAEDAFLELREVAARHVATLRKVAPRKTPLCLVGLGLAGNVAQEMAAQLEEHGVTVRAVIAIQSVVPGPGRVALSRAYLQGLPANLRRAARAYAALPPTERHAQRRALARALAAWLRPQGQRAPALEAPVERSLLPLAYREVSAPQWNALLRHRARPCGAPLFLVRGHRSGLVPRDVTDGFAGLSRAGVHPWVVDATEQDVLTSSDHPSLVALLAHLSAGTALPPRSAEPAASSAPERR